MPEELPDQTFPDPHESFRGYRQKKPAELLKTVNKWSIRGLLLETISTLALYAHRVIDRTDGKAYSADELEAKIIGQVNTPSSSNGGLGEADNGKLAVFGDSGELNASSLFVVHDPNDPDNVFVGLDASGMQASMLFKQDGIASTCQLGPVGLTAPRVWVLPDQAGVVCILPPYANEAAANAAVSVGDGWYDTTLKKARTRMS
jgi:hypothetical protein